MVETFLNDEIGTETLQIEGYKIERKDRNAINYGGGVIAYIRNSVCHQRRIDLEISSIESLWIEIKFPNTNSILIGIFYRPPSSFQSWIDSAEKEIDKASAENKEIILLGDFNINFSHINHTVVGNQKWKDCINLYGLQQIVHKPTRVTDKCATTIDHIYTTDVDHIIEVKVPSYAVSDHYPVCVTRKLNPKISKMEHLSIEYRSFKQFDKNKFIENLTNTPFYLIESIGDVDEAANYWYNLFLSTLDKHAPKKIKRVKKYPTTRVVDF
ncbi:Hypothetical predicted protein [Mytilus galloprovincialis]|uniref:Endonuclease/exonuclease/phosphatase domain-containing protein n=1 Tax=Mytilus galloprovincialis TaxID=29158 RepID=A0A8B6C9P2_MYTGA|nr:Hypothetical predicted protein [Mytilus galloprovincialis]